MCTSDWCLKMLLIRDPPLNKGQKLPECDGDRCTYRNAELLPRFLKMSRTFSVLLAFGVLYLACFLCTALCAMDVKISLVPTKITYTRHNDFTTTGHGR